VTEVVNLTRSAMAVLQYPDSEVLSWSKKTDKAVDELIKKGSKDEKCNLKEFL
jgi:hypothetical protein